MLEKDKNIHLYYKPIGMTMGQLLKKASVNNDELLKKTTFAGRLDPMAEGIVVLLSGEERLKKDQYLSFDKTYVAKIIFGFKTDTFDILGKLLKTSEVDINWLKLQKSLKTFEGNIKQSLPPYSSFRVMGKPLFHWAKEGKLDDIKIPSKSRNVYAIKLIDIWDINTKDLFEEISKSINAVDGDFRQDEILEIWRSELNKDINKNIEGATIEVNCSSGTYIRSIINSMGDKLECGAMSLNILRTKIGPYSIEENGPIVYLD